MTSQTSKSRRAAKPFVLRASRSRRWRVASTCARTARSSCTFEKAAKGGAKILHAGTVREPVLRRAEDHRFFSLAEHSGRAHGRVLQAREEAQGGDRREPVREAREGPLPQHRGGDRRRRLAHGRVSQDAHSRRSALLREVLLHARRHRLQGVEDEASRRSACSSAGTSGSPRGAPHRHAGRRDPFYPTAIGWHPSEKKQYGKAQHESWELIQRSHAVANGCYVCSPNRIGHEHVLGEDGENRSASDGLQFWGQSFICAPDGQVEHRASVDREQIRGRPRSRARRVSRTHWPFLRDRRVDAYGGSLRRFGDEG